MKTKTGRLLRSRECVCHKSMMQFFSSDLNGKIYIFFIISQISNKTKNPSIQAKNGKKSKRLRVYTIVAFSFVRTFAP